ncbi:hypothetical protein E3N88_04820 [Mikania micrantha]|uniref:Uncharacterized protein n=1 Tax=Mikania micrantha TaxID=192012 RepID=A0A5N6PW04_9ASTR|nr:hypothetical protein E3N88_04820 [Mikania micrantha]
MGFSCVKNPNQAEPQETLIKAFVAVIPSKCILMRAVRKAISKGGERQKWVFVRAGGRGHGYGRGRGRGGRFQHNEDRREQVLFNVTFALKFSGCKVFVKSAKPILVNIAGDSGVTRLNAGPISMPKFGFTNVAMDILSFFVFTATRCSMLLYSPLDTIWK